MDYRNINDYELLYLVADNEEAYETLYEKYKPLIKSYCRKCYLKYKKLGIEYDDIYQEALFGFSNAIKMYNENNDCLFYTLALTLIKREVQRYLISFSRYKNMMLTLAIPFQNNTDEDQNDLENILYVKGKDPDTMVAENTEYNNFVSTKFDFDGVESQVFELKYNNFSNVEIANLLDISYKTVDNIIYKIRKRIKLTKLS